MKLSDEITINVYRYLDQGRNGDIILRNFYLGSYEMDVMLLKKSGYITEFEIKISRSDFFNDFKKNRWGENKHECIGKGIGSSNRFMFVVPKGMVSVSEVPKHAGLAYYEPFNNPLYPNQGHVNIIKPAPMIHKNKHFVTAEDFHQLAYKVSFRETTFRNIVEKYKSENRISKSI